MVQFLKPNKAVIVLQSRYTGRKTVIVKSLEEGTATTLTVTVWLQGLRNTQARLSARILPRRQPRNPAENASSSS
ncbi:hypothetical protein CRYUN_Cryun24cG0025800 [Craigia yunnanensis]